MLMIKKRLLDSLMPLLVVLLFMSCGKKVDFNLETDYISLGFDAQGNILSIVYTINSNTD